jgi:hypothetical protein
MTKITLPQIQSYNTPAWLKGRWGTRWLSALGDSLSDLTSWAKDGVKCRFPTLAPSGALRYLSVERGIERYPGETDAEFRVRLWSAWDTWKWSGTDLGVYYGLEACGFTVSNWSTDPWFTWPSTWPEIGHVWMFSYNDVAGYAPDDDNTATHAGRFWIAIDGYAEGINESLYTVGGGLIVGTSGAAIGLNVSAAKVDSWRRSVRKWKGSHMTCPSIFLVLSDGGWGDIIGPFGQLVGDGATVGAVVGEVIVGE